MLSQNFFLEAQDAKITYHEIIFTVQVKDEDAEIFWKKDKKKLILRVENMKFLLKETNEN